MYHYAANNPVRYTDPDGRSIIVIGIILKTVTAIAVFVLFQDSLQGYVKNASDKYIVIRTEDDVSVSGGESSRHYVVLAPGDTYNGGIDGIMDSDGNFYKVSAKEPFNVDVKIDSKGLCKRKGIASHLVNLISDIGKWFKNLGLPEDEKLLYSGFYTKESSEKEGYNYLNEKWGQFIKDNFGNSQEELKNAYDEQPKEIKELITN